MNIRQVHGRRDALAEGFRAAGIMQGDTVLLYVSDGALDPGNWVATDGDELPSEIIFSAATAAVGCDGTVLVPSYSLSFFRYEEFDVQGSPAVSSPDVVGSAAMGEYVRCLPEAIRSADPIFSVAGVGQLARELLTGLPGTSFGKGCLFERLIHAGGKLCSIGSGLASTLFLDYVEASLGVPFRYQKLFTGWVRDKGVKAKQGWIASVRIQAGHAARDGGPLERILRLDGAYRSVPTPVSEVVSMSCRSFHELVNREIAANPWIAVRGPVCNAVESEAVRVGNKPVSVQLSTNASMEEMIAGLWKLKRDIVSDGYDAALDALATQLPLTVHEYPTGTECWTWLVPEKWTCHEAWLETLDGRRLFTYEENPLHVVSYSLPIDREVSREELFEHLHVHPLLPDAIPFIFKYYERDWGLCCSLRLKNLLQDSRYRVVIRTDFSYGTLKVGEVIVPGKSRRSFVLSAHLCHPAMVNDDLSGVVVGMEVMRELLQRKNLHYTYRFLILPETIGSIAYLSHHPELIPDMAGGLFLEMLGLENAHALQLSFSGDSEMDRCLTRTLKEFDADAWTGAFRTVVGNDERQFNAPGVRVPMLSLSRVRRTRVNGWPYYPEYHSSHDTPELASTARLSQSRDLVLRMIDALEAIRMPINRYQGEIFCSRYGLNIDPYANPEGNRALFDILFLIDGTRSVAEIAKLCGISIETARSVLHELEVRGLIEYAPLAREVS